jgi:DNA polymerase elongation subunit (family B)
MTDFFIAHPFDIFEKDVPDETNGEKKTEIHMWCLKDDKLSSPILVVIKGFKVWSYVELPQTYKPWGGGTEIRWSENDAKTLVEKLSNFYKIEILSSRLVRKRKLHYYQSEGSSGFQMLRLEFKTLEDMKALTRKLEAASRIPNDFIPLSGVAILEKIKKTKNPEESSQTRLLEVRDELTECIRLGNNDARGYVAPSDLLNVDNAFKEEVMLHPQCTGQEVLTILRNEYLSLRSACSKIQDPKLALRHEESIERLQLAKSLYYKYTPPTGSKVYARGRDYGPQFGRLVLRAWEGDGSTVTATRKLLSMSNTTYAGWTKFVPTTYGFNNEAIIDFTTTLNLEESVKMAISPAPFRPTSAPKILAIDGEMYSDNHLAFPDAKHPQHAAYMVSAVFQRLRDPSSRKRFVIATAESMVSTNPKHVAYTSTNTIVDEFIIVEREAEIVPALSALIGRLNPDIITGYNIHGFDYRYLDIRYRALGNVYGDWPSEMTRNQFEPVKLVTKKWKSSGYGFSESHTLSFEGRLSVDLLPIIRRDYKLSKYTLDTVSKHFLGSTTGKHSVTPVQMFKAYEEAKTMWKDKTSTGIEANVRRRKAIAAMTKVAAYAIQDSELVIDLFEKLNIWPGLVELSSVAGVTIKDTFARGQQCRIVSLLYDLACRENVVLDLRKVPKPYMSPEEEDEAIKNKDKVPMADELALIRYTGGYVGEPRKGLWDNVICVDFSSLYPSIMIAYNISHDTLSISTTPLEERAFSGRTNTFDIAMGKDGKSTVSTVDSNRLKDDRYSFVDAESTAHSLEFIEETGPKKKKEDDESSESDDDATGKEGARYTFRFANANVRKGLLPRLVSGLVEARKMVRERLAVLELSGVQPEKAAEDQRLLEIQVLHQRQLAYKVTANSTYGFIGAQKGGTFPLVEGAMSVTAKGRQLIKDVNNYVVKTYNGQIIYGDTDSSFFILPDQIKSASECDYWGTRLAKELSELFPPPLKLEFEKAMRVLCLKKKKYAALLINPDGSFAPGIFKRGIVLSRRDNCLFLRETYEQVLKLILYHAPALECFNVIMKAAAAALRNEVPVEKFAVVKSLGANYKQANYSMAVFAEECAKAGRPASPGDRLEYVIVKEPSSDPTAGSGIKRDNLGLRMRLLEVWNESSHPSPIDAFYYLEHMIKNPIDQLFATAFKEVTGLYEFAPRVNTTYSAHTPIKLLTAMIANENLQRTRPTKKSGKMVTPVCTGEETAQKAETLIKLFETGME